MTRIETNINYGNVYRDKITGFEGVAVAITKWQYGCIRVALRPLVDDKGDLRDEEWFDEESIEGIESVEHATGGPTPRPKMNRDC